MTTQDELFAVKLLELARHLSPKGNRVQFVAYCEEQGLRSFFERHQSLWKKIIDDPPRAGITPPREYARRLHERWQDALDCRQLVQQALSEAGIRVLWVGTTELYPRLYSQAPQSECRHLSLLVPPEKLPRTQALLESLGLAEEELRAGQAQALLRWGHPLRFDSARHQPALELRGQPFSTRIGADWLEFEDLWSRREELAGGVAATGAADTIVYLAFQGYESGWSRIQGLLSLALALESLDYTWDEACDIAGPRRVLLERAVEYAVRLLGTKHPGTLTHHFEDHAHALARWARQARAELHGELLKAGTWSCDSSQALKRRWKAILTPTAGDIRSFALPQALILALPFGEGGSCGADRQSLFTIAQHLGQGLPPRREKLHEVSRLATSSDLPAVLRLHEQRSQPTWPSQKPEETSAYLLPRLPFDEFDLFVTEYRGEITGFLLLKKQLVRGLTED